MDIFFLSFLICSFVCLYFLNQAKTITVQTILLHLNQTKTTMKMYMVHPQVRNNTKISEKNEIK